MASGDTAHTPHPSPALQSSTKQPHNEVQAKSLHQTEHQLQSVFSEAEQVMERGALSTSITNAGLSTASLHKGPFSWEAHQELWELLLSPQAAAHHVGCLRRTCRQYRWTRICRSAGGKYYSSKQVLKEQHILEMLSFIRNPALNSTQKYLQLSSMAQILKYGALVSWL